MHGGPGFAMDREEVNFYFRNHTRTPEDLTDPEIYLLKAELHGPPPAFLVVPDRDIIAADSFEMVERLRGAGSVADRKACWGAVHSFLEAIADGARFISRVLGRAGA